MEVIIENILIYSIVGLFIFVVFFFYLRKTKNLSNEVSEKIEKAKESGLYEPVSLHPVIDLNKCMGSGACIAACPEQDILGWRKGKGETINASRCVGHGACFHACPVEAISLVLGTEKRGVELPHVSSDYETNIKGVYIAGELGGMGLIKNAVEQGKSAMKNIIKQMPKKNYAEYDVVIVGAGPAGIAATLTAYENKLKYKTLEQDSLGGTVFSFPRPKIVMTSPMDLPLHGRVKLTETSKSELLTLWEEILTKNKIVINEDHKVLSIVKDENIFSIETNKGNFTSSAVLLSIGRRGSPRKLGIKGEEKEKVAYRLLEPEYISNKHVLVIGGGDSAIESALLICNEKNNIVSLSYRGDSFNRIKPKNLERINEAVANNKINVIYNSTVSEILDEHVLIKQNDGSIEKTKNDLIYIFAGGELPNKFLEKIGIKITKKHGEAILKH